MPPIDIPPICIDRSGVGRIPCIARVTRISQRRCSPVDGWLNGTGVVRDWRGDASAEPVVTCVAAAVRVGPAWLCRVEQRARGEKREREQAKKPHNTASYLVHAYPAARRRSCP